MKQQEKGCLVKRKDHYGFQTHKNDINTRVATRKSNHFTALQPTEASLSEAGSSEFKVVSYCVPKILSSRSQIVFQTDIFRKLTRCPF